MRSLVDEGVKTLFGYPGGAIMPVYDALYDYRDRLNHILVRHEQAATHAAEGFHDGQHADCCHHRAGCRTNARL